MHTHGQRTTCANVFLALSAGLGLWPIQSWSFLEIFGLRTSALATESLSHSPHDHFHHSQMVEVVVSLEQSDTGIEFNQDAAEREGVTWV